MEKECKERGYWVSITILNIDTKTNYKMGILWIFVSFKSILPTKTQQV